MNFLAMMMLFPESQKKVQEEIDSVIGQGRLPDFDDRANLPYLQAVIYETMRYEGTGILSRVCADFATRWHPAVPIGIPHLTTADDVYRGMFIPKGSTVIANATYDALLFPRSSIILTANTAA